MSLEPSEDIDTISTPANENEEGQDATSLIMLVVVIIALAFGGWWIYNHFNRQYNVPAVAHSLENTLRQSGQ